jgi:adenylosuccinate lyase
LICDEILHSLTGVITGLTINTRQVEINLANYAPFANTERLMMAFVKAGADRQKIHESLRLHSMHAWQEIQSGKTNPLVRLVSNDANFLKFLTAGKIEVLMSSSAYIGLAAARAGKFYQTVSDYLSDLYSNK